MPDAPTPDPSPHSRACGWRAHPHGPECSTNCPTCHGGPMPDPSPDTPSEQHTESNKENTTMDNTPNTISIDGTDYVRADSVIGKDFSSSPVRIVVLQRGWVVVGYYAEDGDKVTVEQAKIIRRWGTTKGLGELATGPLSESVLDPAGMVETHRLGVVLTIACDADAWKAHL